MKTGPSQPDDSDRREVRVAINAAQRSRNAGRRLHVALGFGVGLIVSALDDGLILLNVNPYAQAAVTGFVLVTAVALTVDRRKLGFIK